MKILMCLLISLPLFAFSQESAKGIQFLHASSWQEAKAKAKAENKYIFVDAFTTWCGPCRYMSNNIFPQEAVGAFYNANFINLKVQLDTSSNDNEAVKSWYADAHDIMKIYQVNVFPTFLFFDPNGNLVHRSIGSSEAPAFIAKGKDALNPETQYYTLLQRYQQGEKEPRFLKQLAIAARFAYDLETGNKVFDAYYATQTDFFSKENAELLDLYTSAITDKGFTLLLNHQTKYDAAIGKPGAAAKKIKTIIYNTEMMPAVWQNLKPDFVQIEAEYKKKYPAYAAELISKIKPAYYSSKKDWPNFEKSVTAYMQSYSKDLSAEELNEFAWTVFEHSNNAAVIHQAIEWSKRSLQLDATEPNYMDTYANLLYKAGRKKQAIEWETKAMQAVKGDQQQAFSETLEKMKKGEKTWK